MKRITAWLLVLAVILCGCGQETAQLSPAVTLTVAVQEGLSSEAMAGLERFCQKIDALSDGEMTIQLVPSPDVLDSLDQGCNLIFASNDEIARADSNFLSYTSPFYFYDYTHLSQTLNSQAFRDLIAEGTLSLLGALPLAAFYDGNSVILSSGPLSFDTADQIEGADLTISNDPILSDLLRGFGAAGKNPRGGIQTAGGLLQRQRSRHRMPDYLAVRPDPTARGGSLHHLSNLPSCPDQLDHAFRSLPGDFDRKAAGRPD